MKFQPMLAVFFAGLLFGAGLLLGGMTQPSKVIGFLDFAGAWDPSLAFVLAGAVGVLLPLFRLIRRRSTPLFELHFSLQKKADVDAPLVLGALLFGVGWRLAGYCLGPALAALGTLSSPAFIFAGSMFTGFAIERAWDRGAASSATEASTQSAQ